MVFWTIRLASDTLNISLFFRKSDEDDRHVLPLDKIGGKLSFYKYILVFIAWFVLLSRNTHAYQSLFEPLGEALKEPRSIGEFEFTYLSVFIFFFVIFLSGVLAKVVSFLTSGANPSAGYNSEKGPGSWLLLVRIAIISAGAVIAFVAAGIPMDRLAIIIGALSVGIGFGLQTLINNLVSGLIIAFEKPINVGDIVEISGSIGKMKSIGIRSSVISTWDGSDVIIPNGDLLSQHLVNWTMGNTKRRFEIPLSVAYGTNLEETKKMLHDIILQDARILKFPDPIVWVTTFNNSSIDFVLKFWVANFATGFDVKSDLMLAIDKLFKENGIVIPFPQQDVYIKSIAATEKTTGEE
jgi:small-conductance mechanosensitive channel